MSDALVSTEEARVYLGVEKEDEPSDTLLVQIIDGLSTRVLQHTGKTYVNPDEKDKASARQYSYDPSDRALLIDTCRDITVVEATANPNESEGWETIDLQLWLSEPVSGPIFEQIRFLTPELLPAVGSGWSALALHRNAEAEQTPWPHQTRTELTTRAIVRVTAKWGYGADLSTVPANVKLALMMWLQNIHKRDQAFFSEQAKTISKIGMPEDVRELLDGEAASVSTVTAV